MTEELTIKNESEVNESVTDANKWALSFVDRQLSRDNDLKRMALEKDFEELKFREKQSDRTHTEAKQGNVIKSLGCLIVFGLGWWLLEKGLYPVVAGGLIVEGLHLLKSIRATKSLTTQAQRPRRAARLLLAVAAAAEQQA